MITLKEQRTEAILCAFYDSLKSSRAENVNIGQYEVFGKTINSRAPQFYTTVERAQRYVSLLERGLKLPIKDTNKIKMYKEIYKRYIAIKNRCPAVKYSVIEQIINEPAPSFYVSPFTIRRIVYNSLKRR